MRKSFRILMMAAVLAWVPAGWLAAASTPEAKQWLEKLADSYEKKPFKVTYTADLNASPQGQQMTMNMRGNTTHVDRTHWRMEITAKLNMGGNQIEISTLGVADGQTLWMEMLNPMLGGKYATKISLLEADKAGAKGSGLGFGAGGGLDPVAQIHELSNKLDLALGGVADGKVTLRATLDDAAVADLGLLGGGQGAKDLVIVLDEKTAFPLEMRLGGDPPFMRMLLTDLEFVDRAALDPALFSYSPPPGVQVMDLGAAVSGTPAAAPGAEAGKPE